MISKEVTPAILAYLLDDQPDERRSIRVIVNRSGEENSVMVRLSPEEADKLGATLRGLARTVLVKRPNFVEYSWKEIQADHRAHPYTEQATRDMITRVGDAILRGAITRGENMVLMSRKEFERIIGVLPEELEHRT